MASLDAPKAASSSSSTTAKGPNTTEESKISESPGKANLSAVKPDIYFIIDTTGSMSNYIASLRQVIEQLFRMIRILFAGDANIHIIAYKDYCDSNIISSCHENSRISSFIQRELSASGGGDAPEAAKSALNELYRYMFPDENHPQSSSSSAPNASNASDASKASFLRVGGLNPAQSVVFVYTDAPPHHAQMRSSPDNISAERMILQDVKPGFDWIEICKAFARHDVPFYTFLARGIRAETKLFWKLLGHVIELPHTSTEAITQATIGCLCQLMGCDDEREFEYARDFRLLRYQTLELNEVVRDAARLGEIAKNEDECNGLLPAGAKAQQKGLMAKLFGSDSNKNGNNKSCEIAELEGVGFVGLERLDFMANVLKSLPTRLLREEAFRDLVFREFAEVMKVENIMCLSYNSVFGKIWRYLCRFREDERLKLLVDNFGNLINSLQGPQKETMQAWLDESYDSTEEINNIINTHMKRARAGEINITLFDPNATNSSQLDTMDTAGAEDATDGADADESKLSAKDEIMQYVTLDAIDSSLLPTKKELLTISHSLFGDIIEKVQRVMTHLIILSKPLQADPPKEDETDNDDSKQSDEDADVAVNYIGVPWSLDDRRFFALLSHLVVPGTMFTLRPALIMACIAYLSGNVVLKDRARRFISSSSGRWIQLCKLTDYPEFASVPFVKLMIRTDRALRKESNGRDCVVTPRERMFYESMYKMQRIRLARPKLFEIKIGFEPKLREIRRDYKRKCKVCKEFRSFTLMLSDGRCAKCANDAECAENADLAKNGDEAGKEVYSHQVSCRTCQSIYAVIEVDALNVAPKCYYCRENVGAAEVPLLHCRVCRNNWVSPDKNYFANTKNINVKDVNNWLCPGCAADPARALDSVNVSFEDLVGQYPDILKSLFEIELDAVQGENCSILKDFFSGMSLFKLYMKYAESVFAKFVTGPDGVDEDGARAPIVHAEAEIEEKKGEGADELIVRTSELLAGMNAKYRGRSIHNLKELVQGMFETVSYGKLDDICCLCFDTKALLQLESACGKCENLMCFECLGGWYKQLQPGGIVLPTHLLCPFCKQRPKVATMKKYNRQMCAVVPSERKAAKNGNKDVIRRLQLSYRDYFGWCVKCYQIKPAARRECMRGSVPELKDFVCADCKELEMIKLVNQEGTDKLLAQCKKCPECQAPTVKVDGCNHLECACGAHWCYECEGKFDEDDIYDHMQEEHGGFYGVEYE